MTGTNYTVATNAQLLGGNLRKRCECEDIDLERLEIRERTREALEETNNIATGRSPSRSIDSIELSGADILELYADSSEHGTEDSIETAELIDAFPIPKAHLKRSITPDIWLDTSLHIPERSDSTEQDDRKSSVTEIYFSPVDVNGCRFELSSPLNSPLTTPTQESFNAAQLVSKSTSTDGDEKRFALHTRQLDRLVKALVNTPMIQERVRKQACPDQGRAMQLPIVDEKLKPAVSFYTLRTQFEQHFPNHLNVMQAPQAKFCGIFLANPNVNGSPICMLSKEYSIGTNSAKVGQCSYINSPQGGSVECSLRLVDGIEDQTSRVRLQIVNQVLERTTSKKKYLLVTDIDVTESFTKAALIELLHASARSKSEDIGRTETAEDLVKTAVEALAHLQPDTCTMQTLTLMSELDRIRSQFLDFYILRTKETHENGVPSRLIVPWVSQGLNQIISLKDGEDLRQLMVGVVGKLGIDRKAFTSRVEWDGENRRIHCVLLVDGSDDPKISWVCYARDGFDIGYW